MPEKKAEPTHAVQNGDEVNLKSEFGKLVNRFVKEGSGLFSGAVRAAKEREKKIKNADK